MSYIFLTPFMIYIVRNIPELGNTSYSSLLFVARSGMHENLNPLPKKCGQLKEIMLIDIIRDCNILRV